MSEAIMRMACLHGHDPLCCGLCVADEVKQATCWHCDKPISYEMVTFDYVSDRMMWVHDHSHQVGCDSHNAWPAPASERAREWGAEQMNKPVITNGVIAGVSDRTTMRRLEGSDDGWTSDPIPVQASQQPAPIPASEQRIHDYYNGAMQAIIQGFSERVALLEAALGDREELLFISNVMSSVAQGMTDAAEGERRLAERIANKLRAALATPLGTPGSTKEPK